MTEERREYATVDRYVAGETQIIETGSQVVVQLPQLAPPSSDIVLLFDPDGPETERVVTGADAELPNTNDGQLVCLTVRTSLRVVVPRSALKGQSGRLIVRISLPSGHQVGVTTTLGSARHYASCKLLWTAYPGGVSRSLSSQDRRIIEARTSKGSLLASSNRRKPLVNLVAYRLNTNLDFDRDGIACERD